MIRYLLTGVFLSLGFAAFSTEITGCEPFEVDQPRPGGIVVNAADFGLKEQGIPEENVKALREAIAYCKATQAYKLTIPHGVYQLRSWSNEPVAEQLAYVRTSTTNPAVVYQISLEGMTDFVLDGNGAEFIFLDTEKEAMGAFIHVANCLRVKIENLTLDWDWENRPLAAIAFISGINRNEKYIDWYVPYLNLPPDLKINMESGMGSKPWNPVINMRPPEVRPFVLEENSPGLAGVDVQNVEKSEVIDNKHIRVYFSKEKVLEKAQTGQCVNMTFHTNYDPYGIVAENNDHLTFRNLNVYSALNHRGFSSDYNKYLEISGVKIIPRPGTSRSKSSHGTFEIHNSRGYFLFENNVVESEHDDFMHLSDGFVGGGIVYQNDSTLLCERLQYYSARFTLQPDEVIEFLNEDMQKLGIAAEIEKVEWLTDYYPKENKQQACLVTFKTRLPKNLKRETILWNNRLGTGKYIIRNNKATTCACSGIFVTWPNGIIENNELANVGYGGIVLGRSSFGERWFMGPGVSNVIIRGNQLKQVNRVKRKSADMDMMSDKLKGIQFHQILIENNVIEGSVSSHNLHLSNIRDLIVRNNTAIDNDGNKQPATVCITDCENYISE